MKSIILYLFLICISNNIFAQKNDSLTLKKTTVINLLKKDLIVNQKIKDSIVPQIKIDSIYNTVMSKNWDTKKFNPYKGNIEKKPFQLQFTDSTYASPVGRKKVITSRYGWRKGKSHKGIDIDLITGDNVMAMFEGVVRFVHYSTGHGKTVVIRHYNGLETAYAHLSKYVVKVNDTVKKGQIIGIGGTTGNARGSHLHLGVSYKGNYINPEYLFDFGKENKIRKQNFWITKHWVTAHFHTSRKQSNLFYYNNYEEALASQKKQNKRRIHIIKQGDTLSEISNKYRVSLVKLCKTNGISKRSILKIGKKLIIN